MPTDATVALKSCLGAFGVPPLSCFFLKNGKNGHGALVGLTLVTGTSVDKFFLFFEKSWKTWFLALVGLTLVKGTSVQKKDAEQDRKRSVPSLAFWRHA